MTSSDGDLRNILTELDRLSLKIQQLMERRKIQCIFQEMRNRVEFGQTEEATSNLHEIDNIDDELKRLTERKAELQRSHENILNNKDMKHGEKAEFKDMKHGEKAETEDMKHGGKAEFKDMKHGGKAETEDMKHGGKAETEDMKHGGKAETEDMKHEVSVSSRQIGPDVPVPRCNVFYVDAPPNIPAPTVVLDVDKLPPYPCRTQCPECKQFIMTETFTSVSSVTWMVCFIIASVGCVAGCCLIPFCMDDLKSITHRCPRCRTAILTIKKV